MASLIPTGYQDGVNQLERVLIFPLPAGSRVGAKLLVADAQGGARRGPTFWKSIMADNSGTISDSG